MGKQDFPLKEHYRKLERMTLKGAYRQPHRKGVPIPCDYYSIIMTFFFLCPEMKGEYKNKNSGPKFHHHCKSICNVLDTYRYISYQHHV